MPGCIPQSRSGQGVKEMGTARHDKPKAERRKIKGAKARENEE